MTPDEPGQGRRIVHHAGFLKGCCWDDAPPSVPVESREQPRDWHGFAAMFVQDHQPEPGGCTCGFCAWSVEHVAVSLAIELQRERDATIRELRAECAREFESGNEWCQRALASEAALETTRAERDRARDLAAHLQARLTEVEQELRDAENQAYELSMGEDL